MTIQKTNKYKLTKRIVESAILDPTKRIVLWDTEVIGFCIRIYPSGKKTYFLQYRNQDRVSHKIKIGVHVSITTDLAREKAIKLSLSIGVGEDPFLKVPKIKEHTVYDLGEEYLNIMLNLKKQKNDIEKIKPS